MAHSEMHYSFRMERTTFKNQDLIYEAGGKKLVAGLELSGLEQFDWVGVDADFQKWTDPKGEAISDTDQAEVLRRLEDWARQQRLRINIGPQVDIEEMHRDYERRGFNVEHRDDGTVVVTAPNRRSLWSRITGVFDPRGGKKR